MTKRKHPPTWWMVKQFYVIFFEIVGSRSTGTYLVHAQNAVAAKFYVRQLDSDYVTRGPICSIAECADDEGKTIEQFIVDELGIKNYTEHKDFLQVPYGAIKELECGT